MGSMRKQKIIRILCILIAAAALLATPWMAGVRSFAVMEVYSAVCRNRAEKAVSASGARVPFLNFSGRAALLSEGWHPQMLFYDASEEFASQSGTTTRLHIYYTFPSFSVLRGESRLYEPSSPYYTAFCGAYVLSGEACGFDRSGSLVPEEVAEAVRFDLFRLVLDDFGLDPDEGVFEWQMTGTTLLKEISPLDRSVWIRLDARLRVSGAAHSRRPQVRSSLQYGTPFARGSPEEEFAPADLLGRVYALRESEDTGIFIYVLAKEETILDAASETLLRGFRFPK